MEKFLNILNSIDDRIQATSWILGEKIGIGIAPEVSRGDRRFIRYSGYGLIVTTFLMYIGILILIVNFLV